MQVYLGGWEFELHAALVYDLAYYKFWGHCSKTNVSNPSFCNCQAHTQCVLQAEYGQKAVHSGRHRRAKAEQNAVCSSRSAWWSRLRPHNLPRSQ